MNTIRNLLILAATLATAQFAPAAVPSAINYQGRLSNASGTSQQGNRAMSVKLYDADTGGTLLYSENLGNVAVDANGVYAFQFGATGTSDTLVTETLATTDGTTLTYQKALSHTPVLPGSLSVTDGTFSWNETTGNPGSLAHATANVMFGFVVGATVTNGGSGYTAAPVVTITGDGTGAAATATVAGGAVAEITITNAGSGYTTGATITLAPPPAPFVVNYTGGMVTVTYNPAPPAGRTITATYRYSTSGISGALAAGSEQWLELTVDGVAQSPKQKILAVPFAFNAQSAESSSGTLARQIEDLSKDVALMAGGMPSSSVIPNVILAETTLMKKGALYAPIEEQSVNAANTVTYNLTDKKVRGIVCRFEYESTPGNIVFTYTDNTTKTINLTIPGGDTYVANPNPEKDVKTIVINNNLYNAGWRLMTTVRLNRTGVLALSIPAAALPKARIGLFLTKSIATPGDQLSAQLIGTSGIQSISVDSYNLVQGSVGVPQKILVTLSASNSNLEAFSSISGYVIRFSE